jgi:hypothetical protein
MASECLYRLGGESSFDPARYGKVSKAMPIERLDGRELVEQRQELPLDQIVVAKVMAFSVWEDQVLGLREFRFQLPLRLRTDAMFNYSSTLPTSHPDNRTF